MGMNGLWSLTGSTSGIRSGPKGMHNDDYVNLHKSMKYMYIWPDSPKYGGPRYCDISPEWCTTDKPSHWLSTPSIMSILPICPLNIHVKWYWTVLLSRFSSDGRFAGMPNKKKWYPDKSYNLVSPLTPVSLINYMCFSIRKGKINQLDILGCYF